jgi:hypothetical protein
VTDSVEAKLDNILASWVVPAAEADWHKHVETLIEPLYARGVLPDGHESVDAILLGEQYHLGWRGSPPRTASSTSRATSVARRGSSPGSTSVKSSG